MVENAGICYKDMNGNTQSRFTKGRNVVIEEFFHSMHECAIAFVAPDDICRISNLTSHFIKKGIYHPEKLLGKNDSLCSPFERPTVEYYCLPVSDIPIEFIATCVDVWFGQLHSGENDLKSREDIRKRAPAVFELLGKYFDAKDTWKPC